MAGPETACPHAGSPAHATAQEPLLRLMADAVPAWMASYETNGAGMLVCRFANASYAQDNGQDTGQHTVRMRTQCGPPPQTIAHDVQVASTDDVDMGGRPAMTGLAGKAAQADSPPPSTAVVQAGPVAGGSTRRHGHMRTCGAIASAWAGGTC